MNIVIDTNIILAAILKDGIVRRILLSRTHEFFLPEHSLPEIERHKKEVSEKSGLSLEDIEEIMATLLGYVQVVPLDMIQNCWKEGLAIMKEIHAEDAPFIAAALAISADGIWSFDEHLKKQNRVKIFGTRDLAGHLS